MYKGMLNLGVCRNLTEFKHLHIGQIRFFLRKQDEYAALKARSKELTERERGRKKQA